jgi:hypothetical protein
VFFVLFGRKCVVVEGRALDKRQRERKKKSRIRGKGRVTAQAMRYGVRSPYRALGELCLFLGLAGRAEGQKKGRARQGQARVRCWY